jgi:hypothetical protein
LKKWNRNCPHPCNYIAVAPMIRAKFFRNQSETSKEAA